ncbi:MAG: FAD:protein FMN transferase [Candidatus Dormibacteria bacterium]
MTAATRRPVRVEHVMGTVISLDLRDSGVPDGAVEQAIDWFHEVDRRFSTYRDDSEVSRISQGAMSPSEAHPDVIEVWERCEELRRLSQGAFDAWPGRETGRFDPSGLVKGWSVDRAALILAAHGAANFAINAGGDVLVRGEPEPGVPWRVGIRHPVHADRVMAVLHLRDQAVATSGDYERGAHILDPVTGHVADRLASVTVVGSELGQADACATAAFVMGRSGVAWVETIAGCSAAAATRDGRMVYTDTFRTLLAPD